MIMKFNKKFQIFLQTEEPLARAICKGIWEQHLPLMAECLTTNNYNVESELFSVSVSTQMSTDKLQRRDNVDISKVTEQKG